jgi:hypothetical protein
MVLSFSGVKPRLREFLVFKHNVFVIGVGVERKL